MKISSFKKLLDKDFDSQYKRLVYDLALRLNPFLDAVNKALDGKLTFEDNIQSKIIDISSITVGDDFSTTYKINIEDFDIKGIIIINLTNKTNNNGKVNSFPSIYWEKTSAGITIKNIYGLVPNDEYSFKLLVI